ncbi:MAG: zinc-dependent metalloprotease, partial [Acidobacteria bacterium]|nr:zinc-dependent metalloprotease [Acidobacteriota bacterium]
IMTPGQRDTFNRTQALMSLLEGYSNHVMNAAGARILPNFAEIHDRFERREQGHRRAGSGEVLCLQLSQRRAVVENPIESIFREIPTDSHQIRIPRFDRGTDNRSRQRCFARRIQNVFPSDTRFDVLQHTTDPVSAESEDQVVRPRAIRRAIPTRCHRRTEALQRARPARQHLAGTDR